MEAQDRSPADRARNRSPRTATRGERGRLSTIAGAILLTVVLAVLAVRDYSAAQPLPPEGEVAWGVTFSQKAGGAYGLDWRANYRAIVHDLRPAGLRLVAYWDLIEASPGRYDFRDLDWQVREAEQAGIPVILTVGKKVPRWPECHAPRWLKTRDGREREQALLRYVTKVIERYRGSATLLYWQVENETFVEFGLCREPPDRALLEREVRLVRQLDPGHPVLITDSGELGEWWNTAPIGDVFGTTLYRHVYNRWVGTFSPPYPPEYYPAKEWVTKRIIRRPDMRFLCVELAAEPWGAGPVPEMTMAQQEQVFSNAAFEETVGFARRTRSRTLLFWGAEWWYYRKVNGDPSYWNQAKHVIAGGQTVMAP